jgi:hypothetical protein
MAERSTLRIPIIPRLFKDELAALGISIRSFDNPESNNYIGVTSKTIHRGIRNGWLSRKTVEALSDIMDVERFVIDVPYDDIELLQKENIQLKLQIDRLTTENDFLKDRLKWLNNSVNDICEQL